MFKDEKKTYKYWFTIRHILSTEIQYYLREFRRDFQVNLCNYD